MKPLVILASLFLVACNSETSVDHSQHTTDTSAKTMEHHKEAATNTVQLDNGKKWKANPETITGIRNMRQLTDAGLAGTLQEQPLVDSLQQELKTIFDKCTMKGEAHEQLHQYLVPLKNRLDVLKTGAKREETLLDIRAYLETFDNYFEA